MIFLQVGDDIDQYTVTVAGAQALKISSIWRDDLSE